MSNRPARLRRYALATCSLVLGLGVGLDSGAVATFWLTRPDDLPKSAHHCWRQRYLGTGEQETCQPWQPPSLSHTWKPSYTILVKAVTGASTRIECRPASCEECFPSFLYYQLEGSPLAIK